MPSNFPPANPDDVQNLSRLGARLGLRSVTARSVLVLVVGEGIGRCYDQGGVKRDALDALARDLIVAGMEDAAGNETFRYEAGMPFLRAAVSPMLASCGNGPPGGGGGGGGGGARGDGGGGVFGALTGFFGGASVGAQAAVDAGMQGVGVVAPLAVTALSDLPPALQAGVQAGMQVGVNVGTAVLPVGTARIVDLEGPPPLPPRRIGLGAVVLGVLGVAGIAAGAFALLRGPSDPRPADGVRSNPSEPERARDREGRRDPEGRRRVQMAAARLNDQLGFASVGIGGRDFDWRIEVRVSTSEQSLSVPGVFEGFPVNTVVLGRVHASST